GLKIDTANPLDLEFIIDTANEDLNDEQLREQSCRFIRYFLTCLTIPEKDMWVNLSPEEADRIISDELVKTEFGKGLLEQDCFLKRLASGLTYPDSEIGKSYWDDGKGFDLSKIWIVLSGADVYADHDKAFVVNVKFKVESDGDYSSIISAIEYEVNNGSHFVELRQMCNALILAAWYKLKLKDSLIAKVYADKKKVKGVDTSDPELKEIIYQQYLDVFKKGAYDLIKKEYDPTSNRLVKRRYFSGGFDLTSASAVMLKNLQPIKSNEIKVSSSIRKAKQVSARMNVLSELSGVGSVIDKTAGSAVGIFTKDSFSIPSFQAAINEAVKLCVGENGEPLVYAAFLRGAPLYLSSKLILKEKCEGLNVAMVMSKAGYDLGGLETETIFKQAVAEVFSEKGAAVKTTERTLSGNRKYKIATGIEGMSFDVQIPLSLEGLVTSHQDSLIDHLRSGDMDVSDDKKFIKKYLEAFFVANGCKERDALNEVFLQADPSEYSALRKIILDSGMIGLLYEKMINERTRIFEDLRGFIYKIVENAGYDIVEEYAQAGHITMPDNPSVTTSGGVVSDVQDRLVNEVYRAMVDRNAFSERRFIAGQGRSV
ncbi:MAG: hypothetical protein GXY14_05135, partial [Spirochaetes bacterium]|nr:hypothetical protein [Spirochaetota bacterium]